MEHISQRRERALVQELPGLIDTASNYVGKGKGKRDKTSDKQLPVVGWQVRT